MAPLYVADTDERAKLCLGHQRGRRDALTSAYDSDVITPPRRPDRTSCRLGSRPEPHRVEDAAYSTSPLWHPE